MNIEIKQIEDQQAWDNFVKEQEYTLFVQSYKYGEFFSKMDEKYWLFGIYNDNKLIGGSLVVSTHAKRGNFLYLPFGPIIAEEQKDNTEIILKTFFEYLKEFAKKNKYDFIKCSPFIEDTLANKNLYEKIGFKNSPIHILAETTWILNLEKKEEELMIAMNKNHRNLIRRCLKENVTIKKFTVKDQASLDTFNNLLSTTAKRHKFQKFSEKYVNNEFNSFIDTQEVILLQAYIGDKLDSSAIVFYFGNMGAYRHGASLGTNNKIPTTYLIQWEAIKEAKARGCKYYNFWGIAPDDATKKHPYWGITHFKKGFDGFKIDLLHCQDMPITYKYWLNWLIETGRRIKRGF